MLGNSWECIMISCVSCRSTFDSMLIQGPDQHKPGTHHEKHYTHSQAISLV